MACKNLTTKVTKFKIIDLLAELKKRVPKNQEPQFHNFQNMCHKYQSRVDKFPEKLPRIDWDYYRTNVRKDYVQMVDDFEKKYEELNQIFDSRSELDTSMYMKDVDKLKEEVKIEVDKFIKESNERIKKYEEEIERLRKMIPYEEMTCEEFCELGPEYALRLGVGNSFWPHVPEEQFGYVRPEMGMSEEDKHLQKEIASAQGKAAQPMTGEVASGVSSAEKAGAATGSVATAPQPKTAEESKPTATAAAAAPKSKPAEAASQSIKAAPKPKPEEKSTETAPKAKPKPAEKPASTSPEATAKPKPKPKEVETPPTKPTKDKSGSKPSSSKEKISPVSKESAKKSSKKEKETDKKKDPEDSGKK